MNFYDYLVYSVNIKEVTSDNRLRAIIPSNTESTSATDTYYTVSIMVTFLISLTLDAETPKLLDFNHPIAFSLFIKCAILCAVCSILKVKQKNPLYIII